jgi:hypothetical protein
MNLDREHLIKIVDAKLATHKAAWEKEHAEDLARVRKAAEVWIATMGPKWTVAISNMTKALKANKPITDDMLPEGGGGYGRDYSRCFQSRLRCEEYVPPAELLALRDLLEICTDSSVNVSKLGGKSVLDTLSRYK